MKITLRSLSERGAGRVAVLFEIENGESAQRETFLISPSAVADLSLRVGECDTACFDAVERCAALEAAVQKGLRMLGYGSSSRKVLCRKLTEKGVERSIAREAVEEICRLGYLDEKAQALREAERCASKLWGERRIAAVLQDKGYSRESIAAAFCELEDRGVDFVDLCARRIREGAPKPEDPVERKKWTAAMCRYGFTVSQIRDAIDRISEE